MEPQAGSGWSKSSGSGERGVRALVAGHLCIDFFPAMERPPGWEPGALYTIGPMRARPGGCVYTTGRTMAALGIDVRLSAAVGRDVLSGLLLELCRAEGIPTDGLVATDTPTSYTLVSQPAGLDRTFWHYPGANEVFDGRDLDLTGVDLVHVGYPNLMAQLYVDDGARLVELFRRARTVGCATSIDLAVMDTHQPDRVARWTRFLERVLPWTDVISPSVADLTSMVGWPTSTTADDLVEAARWLVAGGVAVALVTGGAQGAVLATAGADRLAASGRLAPRLDGSAGLLHAEAALPVPQVADTTGAGDVATAGFLAGLLSGAGPVAATGWAARAAARHVCGGVHPKPDPSPSPGANP